jgi:excisionase family DNA binding protein
MGDETKSREVPGMLLGSDKLSETPTGPEPSDDRSADAYVTVGQAAQMLHVSPKTVNRWANEGRIPCIVTFGGHRRFRRKDIEASVTEMLHKGAQLWREPPGGPKSG